MAKSARSPINVLTPDEVDDIFFGKRSRLPRGEPVMPVDQIQDAQERTDFYMKISGKTPVLMKAYWSKIYFTAEGRPPAEISSLEALKKFIINNPSALTYMNCAQVSADLKIVAVVGD